MLPTEYIDRMKKYLGEEFGSFLASYDDAPSVGLRVNTLKITPEAFLIRSPYPLQPLPWSTVGFTLPVGCRPGTHPYHAAGLYYLQDPAAMAVTEVLDPQPGERILDLAAAPGGKTTHIAARMMQQGVLVANDTNPRRVKDLCNNLERWGARNTLVLNETPQRLAAHFGSFFDKVLVDAPCSGEGMFRKDPSAIFEWSQRVIDRCASRQDAILGEAARLVRSGGRLVYATCTFAPEEDEGSVHRFLIAHPEFEVEEVNLYDGFTPGRPDWLFANGSGDLGVDPGPLSCTVRLWPHLAPGEGHYIAVLRKKGTQESRPNSSVPFQYSSLTAEAKTYFASFTAETLSSEVEPIRLSMQGSYLYKIPDGLPDVHGLRVVHWGWWLGIFKSRRFEPSQTLVMALTPDDLKQVCDFQADDPNLMSYLRGEVLPDPGPGGWVMVAVDGYPLGWAKRVQNRLKPRFPRWLRKAN